MIGRFSAGITLSVLVRRSQNRRQRGYERNEDFEGSESRRAVSQTIHRTFSVCQRRFGRKCFPHSWQTQTSLKLLSLTSSVTLLPESRNDAFASILCCVMNSSSALKPVNLVQHHPTSTVITRG